MSLFRLFLHWVVNSSQISMAYQPSVFIKTILINLKIIQITIATLKNKVPDNQISSTSYNIRTELLYTLKQVKYIKSTLIYLITSQIHEIDANHLS